VDSLRVHFAAWRIAKRCASYPVRN
jgi:hypothetical protein